MSLSNLSLLKNEKTPGVSLWASGTFLTTALRAVSEAASGGNA
ncbi:hypothetical protein GGP79_003039 [Salinibacter ruber]|jgi:hypothetical protein|nr:hypothetical protein [Salinibacter ruber]MCS3701946.1 hypothetical protein [Salinibacter ruber]MCS3755058.1 hypothetical protein [Salinibacter ruber]